MMQRKVFHILALVTMLLLTACSDNTAPQESSKVNPVPGQPLATQQYVPATPLFRSIPPQEARALMAQRQDLVLIDLREPQELREGFIPGSQLLPIGELAKGRATLPTGRPLLLICAVGGRSYAVGQYFYRKGLQAEIYNLAGGIDAWKRAGLPVQYQ